MKRTFIFCLSLIMGLATMMAQDAAKCDQQNKGQRPMLSPEQKAQLITDRMVKAYDLNDDQKTKLFDLNLKALSRQACHRGHKADCPKDKQQCDKDKQQCPKTDCKKDGAKAECPKDKKDCSKPDCKGEGHQCEKGDGHHPMPYVKALAEILTPEQFQAWRTDKMIERSLMPQRNAGPQGHRGQFGHRGGKGQCPQGMKNCQKPCPKDKQQCAKADCKKDCTKCKDCKKGCDKCKDCKKDCSKCKDCKK